MSFYESVSVCYLIKVLLSIYSCINLSSCYSMAGKQVFEVPPTNVGGSPCCIAVCVRGMDAQKVGVHHFDSIFW